MAKSWWSFQHILTKPCESGVENPSMWYILFFYILLLLLKPKKSLSSSQTPSLPSLADCPHIDGRPSLIQNDTINYFACGSNLLLSKLLSRGATPITVLSFVPSTIPHHRLSFNMKGFPPLEPCMSGVTPSPNTTIHGGLALLPRSSYESLWLSEGGGSENPPYVESVVDCYPYGEDTPVQAVAFTPSPRFRLTFDGDPSKRYMRMLIQGGKELGLDIHYQEYLENIETASVNGVVRFISVNYLFFGEGGRGGKRRADNAIESGENRTRSYFRTRRASSVTTAIIFSCYNNPFRDFLRSSQ